MLIRPRYLVLDSSQIGDWVRDRTSKRAGRREAAQGFEQWLLKNGYVVLLTWHHLEELIALEDEQTVLQRLRFIKNSPFIGWVGGDTADAGLGGIIQMLAAEASVVMERPDATALEVREIARSRFIHVGSGEKMMGEDADIWLTLRPFALDGAKHSRVVIAITRCNATDASNLTVAEVLGAQLRSGEALKHRLGAMRCTLSAEIRDHGDERISNPVTIAFHFMQQVANAAGVFATTPHDLVYGALGELCVRPHEINPQARLGDLLKLGLFRSQLKVVAESMSYPVEQVVETVRMNQLPSWIIIDAIRDHAQELDRRKGSEMKDSYLACLAAYADLTFVDRRTKENLRRAIPKVSAIRQMLRRIEKVTPYENIAECSPEPLL